jgi:RNA-binding protein 26
LFFFKYSCDADPTVLAQYIVALIGHEELNDALKLSLQEKLSEFFDDRKSNG